MIFSSEYKFPDSILIIGEKAGEKRHRHACLKLPQQLQSRKFIIVQFHSYNVNGRKSALIKSECCKYRKNLRLKKETKCYMNTTFDNKIVL